MKKIIILSLMLFAISLTSIAQIGINLYFTSDGQKCDNNGFRRGVSLEVYNQYQDDAYINRIEVFMNNCHLGSIGGGNLLVRNCDTATYTFAITNKYHMPNDLPKVVIYYTINDVVCNTSSSQNTKIDVVDGNEKKIVIYDLGGRIVKNPIKGNVYIVNGKKVKY
jgi:hypothetical protein